MAALRSLVHLSNGNVPSRWASTSQAAKMAQAFSRQVDRFTFVTSGDLPSLIWHDDAGFEDWYGLHHAFRIVRVPVAFRLRTPLPQDFRSERYFKLAVLYALLKRPSLIYTRSTDILKLCLKADLPVLWEKHEVVPDPPLMRRAASRDSFLGLVTTSQALADEYVRHGIPPARILVAPNAVDLEMFEPYQTKHAARQMLQLGSDRPIVVYSGHLYDYKGIPTILDVARMLPRVRFILVGGWDVDADRVRSACERDGLTNVLVAGHVAQSQLARYLYAADVLILPTSSMWDQAAITCPLKLFDYMAARRPIVAAALPLIAMTLQDGRNGLLAEPDDAPSFARAVEVLLSDRPAAEQMAERAFRDVQNRSWDERASRILEFAEARLRHVEPQLTRANTLKAARALVSG